MSGLQGTIWIRKSDDVRIRIEGDATLLLGDTGGAGPQVHQGGAVSLIKFKDPVVTPERIQVKVLPDRTTVSFGDWFWTGTQDELFELVAAFNQKYTEAVLKSQMNEAMMAPGRQP